MIPIIYGYKMDSESAVSLSQSLFAKKVYPDRKYKYKDNHLIVNLGNSISPIWRTQETKWVNKPENVAIAVNKLLTFNRLKEGGVSIPLYSTKKEDAINWLKKGYKVVCRELLCSHSAKGLIIATKEEELSDKAKVFVRYWPKKHEYRVHLVKNGDDIIIFDFAQKKKRVEIPNEEMNYQIRNHGQWIFARDQVILPDCVKNESVKAMRVMQLDLASVDICYSVNYNKCITLELNTCSGMCPITLENYTNEILALCHF